VRLRLTLGRLTFVWILLAGVAAFGLFHVTFAVRDIESKLRTLNRQIGDDRQAIHVLEAEWAYLNQPSRLTELSERHLGMVPLTARQIGEVSGLPTHRPLEIPSYATPAARSTMEGASAWSTIRLRVRPGTS